MLWGMYASLHASVLTFVDSTILPLLKLNWQVLLAWWGICFNKYLDVKEDESLVVLIPHIRSAVLHWLLHLLKELLAIFKMRPVIIFETTKFSCRSSLNQCCSCTDTVFLSLSSKIHLKFVWDLNQLFHYFIIFIIAVIVIIIIIIVIIITIIIIIIIIIIKANTQ